MGKFPSRFIPRPSRPRKLLPNDKRVPSCFSATVEEMPKPNAIESFKAVNSIGGLGSPQRESVPSPSMPPLVVPQPQTAPSDLIAYERPSPATIRTTLVRPGTCAGTECAVKSDAPIPNSPRAFPPQVQTVPSDLSAIR